MDSTQTQPWDAEAYLQTKEDMFAYLEAVVDENDSDLVVAALSDVSRARGKTAVDEHPEEHKGN